MASPQIENGYTKIANELFSALCRLNVKGSEFMVALTVVSKTYGWNKKSDQISLTQFQKHTGLTRPRLSRAIKSLVRYGVLGSNTGDTSTPSTYWVEKDYEKWNVPSNVRETSNTDITRTGNVLSKKLVTPVLHTKDNIQKTIKDSASFDAPFNLVWSKYPKRIGRKAAERHFASSVKTENDLNDIQKALDNYLKSERVSKGFIQNASTWFNNWRDWIDFKEISTTKESESRYDKFTGYEKFPGTK